MTCTYTGPDVAPGGFLPTLIINVQIAPVAGFPGGSDRVENCAEVRNPDDGNSLNNRGCVSTVIVEAVFALMAALCHRQRSGEGQHIDVSAWETVACLVGDRLLECARGGRNLQRQGNQDATMVPHNVYPCEGEDQWVSIAVGNEREWEAFCCALGHPEWNSDERFADPRQRWQHREELDSPVAQWTQQRTAQEATQTLQRAGVAAAPSLSTKELAEDPHLRQQGSLQQVQDPIQGQVGLLGAPWRFSRTPARIQHCPMEPHIAIAQVGPDGTVTVWGDSAITPQDPGATSSKATYTTGNAVRLACQDAKRQIFEKAANLLEARAEDLETAQGRVFVRGR